VRVLIVGGGEVGFALARALSIRHEVVVIDHQPDAADRFDALDVEFVAGGGTAAQTLKAAGVERADVFIGCTGLDEVNIVACAMANQFGSPQTVCFVSREDFLSAGGEQGLAHFGINRVIWPEAQLAADIHRIVIAPGAIDAEEFAGGAVRLLEYRLDDRSVLMTGSVADLGLPHGSLLVAVRRGETFFIPRGDSQLLSGDKAIVMGTPPAMTEVQRRMAAATSSSPTQLVTIIGGGDVGLRLAEGLDRTDGIQLRVVERDRTRGEMLAARLRRALVLTGDGTDLELLESEDIGRSDVLVSVIDNDEKNLLASLLGRQLGARRVITRVSKPANLRLFERVGVDVTISARGAAVASVLHELEGGASSLLAVLEEGEGRIIELEVPATYRARALRDLDRPRDSIVGAILRDGAVIVPRGDDRIEPGDRILVFSTRAAADRVRDFFRSAAT
jgi:trk system potassium uptake protein TrkA